MSSLRGPGRRGSVNNVVPRRLMIPQDLGLQRFFLLVEGHVPRRRTIPLSLADRSPASRPARLFGAPSAQNSGKARRWAPQCIGLSR